MRNAWGYYPCLSLMARYSTLITFFCLLLHLLSLPSGSGHRGLVEQFVGGLGGGGTPGPFSNPAGKPASADCTWNDSSWERRSSPTFFAQLSSPGPSRSFFTPHIFYSSRPYLALFPFLHLDVETIVIASCL